MLAHPLRRPRESGDPYAVSPVVKVAVRRLSRNNYALWLWVPAFAGTTKRVSVRAPTNSRHCERSEAIHVAARERMDCFVASLLAMTQTQLRDLAACFARGLIRSFRPPRTEGAGNAGRPMRPIAACAEGVVAGTRVVRSHRQTPGIPRAMVYGLCRALPGDRALLSPSLPRSLLPGSLTPASRRQDHTILPSASRALRQRHISVHRIPLRVS